MKPMTVEMPPISQCDVTQCAYNQNRNCRAKAITVGDRDDHPGCDTLFTSQYKTHDKSRIAGVGACKVAGCMFNNDLECSAEKITVNQVANDVRCTTYLPKVRATA